MNVLFLGDIVGHGGLSSVSSFLPSFKKKNNIDFVIANGENVSNGKGILESDFLSLINNGVDVVTLGNHYGAKKQIFSYAKKYNNLIFPLNLIGHGEINGSHCFDVNGIKIQVTNLLGQAFLNEVVKKPFDALSNLILNNDIPLIHIVDFHAESTSEKATLAFSFDGVITALLGTHTHVQTNDCALHPKGSAFISDVGFCGYSPSIIGFEPSSVIDKTIYGIDCPFKVKENGDSLINGVLLKIDESTGFCKEINSIYVINGKEKENGKVYY